ncbi:iron transporter [Halostella pelagica]|uniref:iron transporter n=1 Tax=Halostella pelagica TaxID=2583824 RepID=UPI001080D010|nr:iron transporter [Halostella pelagica]
MDRRDVLRAGGGLGATALAGCLGSLLETDSSGIPPVLDDRPDAVYLPTHREGMAMVGSAETGDYKFALTYSYPHRFWTVTGEDVEKQSLLDKHDAHVMAVVWDPESRTVLPDTGLSLEIRDADGDLTSEEVIYPMISQTMGFHYGANFSLDGDGTYDVSVSVGGTSTRRTRGFEGKFGDPASVTIEWEYSEERTESLAFEEFDDAGAREALSPMSMSFPNAVAPDPLPGERLGEAESGDAVFVVTALDAADFGGDGTYLALSARTRYNEMLLPEMAVSGTLERDGETVFDGPFERALDPELNYHYGAAVDGVESGDELTIRVEVPPQTARHEGYETAFVTSSETTLSVE